MRVTAPASTLERTRRLHTHYSGKHALITGGSSGIGAAVARRLVELGAGVTLVARRPAPLTRMANELRELRSGVTVRALALDIADQASVAAVMPAELEAQPIDLLVNNAGVAHVGVFMSTDPDRFRSVIETNFLGTVGMIRAVLPHLVERGPGGHIVNVGSMLSLEGVYGYSAYSSSKFALNGLSQALRAELRPHGIGVSLVQPPNTDTPQLAEEVKMMPPELHRLHAIGRVYPPDVVADELLTGVAKGRFQIIPGRDSRMLVRLHRLAPGVMRAYFDRLIRVGEEPPA